MLEMEDWARKGRITIALLCFVLGTSARQGTAQILRVLPDHVMADESADLQVSGLRPGEQVTIWAELVDGAQQRWRSEGEFTADRGGTVDTGTQRPVRGTYRSVSAMGLVWSMRPEARSAGAYRRPAEYGAQVIRFHLLRGEREVAAAELRQDFLRPGVRQIRLHGALHGSVYLPAATGRWPGVLVLGGEDGAVPEETALWLASHGYAAMALKYFADDGLPARLEGIPLEYFGRALAWMQGQPEIAGERLGVVGTSRGGELALQLASVYPGIRAAVAYAPSSVRFPSCCGRWLSAAWTLRGQPLSYDSSLQYRPAQRQDESAAIQVERAHGAILVISGGQDGVWPSTLMTQEIVSRLKETGFTYRYERLDYPHAGHSVGSPDIVPAWRGAAVQPQTGAPADPGGSAEGNAESGIDAGPKVLEFLAHALGSAEEVARSEPE